MIYRKGDLKKTFDKGLGDIDTFPIKEHERVPKKEGGNPINHCYAGDTHFQPGRKLAISHSIFIRLRVDVAGWIMFYFRYLLEFFCPFIYTFSVTFFRTRNCMNNE